MSQSRCGLQVSRDITITKDHHNWPRKKQLGCLINGSIKRPGESMITTDLAEDELDNQRAIAKREKMDVAELSLGKLTEGVEGLLGKVGKSEEKQSGEGFGSTLLKLANILPLRKIGESVASTISNAFPDSDENARNIFPGEHHAVVKLSNGKFGRANYTGPGTRIVERLAREPGGDPPRVPSDKISQAHDIRYGLAENEADVRKADLKMLSSLADLKREKRGRNVNIIPAMIGIRGKVLAENFGLLSRNAFIDPNFKPSPSGLQLMRNKLKELKQEGFGGPVPDRMGVSGPIHGAGTLPRSGRVRDQTKPIAQSVPQARPKIAKFGGPTFLNAGPGLSSTQSLVGIYGSDNRRGVALDRRGNFSSLADRLKPQLNTRAEFRNRRSGVSQTGSGQNPGMVAAASSEMIDIKTSSPGQVSKGKGWPGVNPVDVQTGSGRRKTLPLGQLRIQIEPPGDRPARSSLPGTNLLKKLNKKIQKRKSVGGRVGSRPRKRNPLFMEEHIMSKIMANQLLPMIMV